MNPFITSIWALLLVGLQGAEAIDPQRDYTLRPEMYELSYEEIKVATADGFMLNTWVIEPDSSVAERNLTWVIVGSDAGNMGFSLPYAAMLVRQGYRVVTFDYRGFGASDSFPHNPDNLYHSEYITDLEGILDWVEGKELSEKTGVLAFSMGSLIAISAYDTIPYDILVAEAFIPYPEKIVKRIQDERSKTVILPQGYKDHIANLSDFNIPVLLFASTTDPITTIDDSQHFVESNKNRDLISFNGEHLRGAISLGLDEYISKIVTFAERLNKKALQNE